ncbi:hypothetical protein [Streptomyces sp. NPDC002343]
MSDDLSISSQCLPSTVSGAEVKVLVLHHLPYRTAGHGTAVEHRRSGRAGAPALRREPAA